MDLRQTISDHQGWFESITGKIPLYKGYKEKEMRREADALLREHLAKQFGEQLGRAEEVASQMLTGPGMMQLDEMGKGNTRLQTLIDKIKTAAQGYAGLFDAIKVKENELDILYEFDYNMLVKVDEVAEAIDALQAALDEGDDGKVAPAVRRYVKTVGDATTLFDTRKDKLLGLA
ncbi:MAG: hypothetical protein JW953_18955 [Anaerolineae bacterium]|nr:hypothetical protein [Anaerolineae bacterium]